MRLKSIPTGLAVVAATFHLVRAAEPGAALPGTQPLTLTGDLSAQMVAGIDKFLPREALAARFLFAGGIREIGAAESGTLAADHRRGG